MNFKNNKTKPIFVDNLSWLKDLKYLNFLRDTGKYFTINKMLSFDSVKLRLEREQSLSYMEFNYMIIQAFDFLKFLKRKIVFFKLVVQINGGILLMALI